MALLLRDQTHEDYYMEESDVHARKKSALSDAVTMLLRNEALRKILDIF